MNFLLGVTIGLSEIRAHKFRSFLTMLGIILGVASLLSMFALSAGIANGMRENLKAVGGVEQVGVNPKEVSEKLQDLASTSPGRTMEDARRIREHVPLGGQDFPRGQRAQRRRDPAGPCLAAERRRRTPDFLSVNNHELSAGRFLCDLDVERRNRVVVHRRQRRAPALARAGR